MARVPARCGTADLAIIRQKIAAMPAQSIEDKIARAVALIRSVHALDPGLPLCVNVDQGWLCFHQVVHECAAAAPAAPDGG
jgi:hypothetical protein